MVFLFSVSIMPFSTMLLGQFMEYRIALLTYWLNIVLAGGALYFSWNCAKISCPPIVLRSNPDCYPSP